MDKCTIQSRNGKPRVKPWWVGKSSPRQRGETHTFAKLTNLQVLEIRRRAKANEDRKVLAKEFAVSPTYISLIVNRRRWRDLPEEME